MFFFSREYTVRDAQSRNTRSYADFVADYRSKLWFSYRRNFEPLYQLQTDAGWGCMFRSGQMVLAEALARHLMGRDWRLPSFRALRLLLPHKYLQILALFADRQTHCAVFSIHNMANAGERFMNRAAGHWFGPTPVARILRQLMRRHASGVRITGARGSPLRNHPIAVLVPNNAIVSILKVHKRCTNFTRDAPSTNVGRHVRCRISGTECPRAPSGPMLLNILCGRMTRAKAQEMRKWGRSLLVIIPMRLGLTRLCSAYDSSLVALLRFPQSVGFIGGKPGHSLYFIGTHGASGNVLYLDPHTVHVSSSRGSFGAAASHITGQRGGNFAVSNTSQFYESYHCQRPRSMPMNAIDPSLALGFYCRNVEDFCDFSARAKALELIWENKASALPIFSVNS